MTMGFRNRTPAEPGLALFRWGAWIVFGTIIGLALVGFALDQMGQ
jgi:hypothetical protein